MPDPRPPTPPLNDPDLHLRPTLAPAEGAEAPAAPAERAETPGDGPTLGPYRILEKIGEGGFGVVHLAEQRKPVRRRVALKVLKPGLGSREIVVRFEAERQALALMDHPSVARVFDAGVTDTGLPWFAMEHVPGLPITDYCDQASLTTRQRIELFIPVCQAVQHAHQKGIIHRDLKPTNILVSLVDGKPVPKVIDFGIAKAITRPLTDHTLHTEVGRMIGTPEYMSPEQAGTGGLDVDTRADVYSLGVVLYELLTGSLPFDPAELRRAGLDSVQRVIREVDPPKPSTRVWSLAVASPTATTLGSAPVARTPITPEQIASARSADPRSLARQLRGELDWITMKAMEKDRTRRYASAGELAADLGRHLVMEPVLAGPPSAIYRAGKLLRRHRAVATAGAAVLLCLIAGLAVSTVLYRRAEEQAARATAAVAFVRDMFASIDPEKSAVREVTVREMLDTAAAKAAFLADQPATEGSVREILGEAYNSVGRFDQSVEQLTRALALAEARLGPDDPRTLDLLSKLGAATFSSGNLEASIPMIERVYEARRRVLGEDHKDTLNSLSLLARVQQDAGDLDKAEASLRRAIEGQVRTLGPADRETIEARSGLADLLQTKGDLPGAEREARETVEIAARTLGDTDPLTIQARSIRGSILNDMARYEEALPLLTKASADAAQRYGPAHPRAMTVANTIVTTLRKMGRTAEAESEQRRIVAEAEKNLGPDHPTTLAYLNNLAQIIHPLKRFDEAEVIYRRVLEARRRDQGPTGQDTLTSLVNLGLMLLDAGRPTEALPLLVEARAGLEATLPPDHWKVGATRGFVAECLTALGRYDEAEPLLLEAHKGLVASLGADHPRTRSAADELAKLYTAWKKPEQAEAWRAKGTPPPPPAPAPAAPKP